MIEDLITGCPACGQIHERTAHLANTVADQAKTISGLKTKLNQELRSGPKMDEIGQVFDHWLETCRADARGKKPKLDNKRITTIRARIKDGWDIDDLNRAIDGYATDDWTMGRDKRTKGATKLSMVERLLADSGAVEHGLSLADQADRGEKPAQSTRQTSTAQFADRPADPGSAIRRVLHALENRDLKLVKRAGGWEAQCPAHDDRTPSLGVDPSATGALLCCQRGCSIDQICAALDLEVAALFDTWVDPYDKPLPKVLKATNGRMPAARQPDPLPDETDLDGWHHHLLGNGKALEVLAERKMWTSGTFTRYGIGLHQKRLIFPVRDAGGTLLTLVRYSPAPRDGQPKSLGVTGRGRHPFPPPEFYDPQEKALWIVEGEPDVLSAHEMNLNAVAIPGVEWAKPDRLNELAPRLAGQKVVICFDSDLPGRQAAARALSVFDAHGLETTVVDLAPDRQDGYDVGDVLKELGPDRGEHVMIDWLLHADQQPRQLEVAA